MSKTKRAKTRKKKERIRRDIWISPVAQIVRATLQYASESKVSGVKEYTPFFGGKAEAVQRLITKPSVEEGDITWNGVNGQSELCA